MGKVIMGMDRVGLLINSVKSLPDYKMKIK